MMSIVDEDDVARCELIRRDDYECRPNDDELLADGRCRLTMSIVMILFAEMYLLSINNHHLSSFDHQSSNSANAIRCLVSNKKKNERR